MDWDDKKVIDHRNDIINQLKNGGNALITIKIINKDNKALNLFVLIFLFIESNNFNPEYSILIRCNPMKPKIKGKRKLKVPGKKLVKSKLKKEFKNTINILKVNKVIPEYR